MLQIPILVLFNAFYVRRLHLRVRQSDQSVLLCNDMLSVSERMWDSCCYSVTCTCGPASLAWYLSTTSSWTASLTTFKVRWINHSINGDYMTYTAEFLWNILPHPDSPWVRFSVFLWHRHCPGGHLPHPSGSVLFRSFPSRLLIPWPGLLCRYLRVSVLWQM